MSVRPSGEYVKMDSAQTLKEVTFARATPDLNPLQTGHHAHVSIN